MLCSDWSSFIFFAFSKSWFSFDSMKPTTHNFRIGTTFNLAGSFAPVGSKGSCDPVHLHSLTGARAARIRKKSCREWQSFHKIPANTHLKDSDCNCYVYCKQND